MRLRHVGWGLLSGLLVAIEFANANSAVRGRSLYDSQDPFEIVYSNTRNEVHSEPGIYALVRGQAEGRLIMAGQVLDAGPSFSGVVAQFEMTKTTKRYESFAVVNGKLVLFSHKSSSQDPNSILIFGENVHLRDAIDHSVVNLGPIFSTLEDSLTFYLPADSTLSDAQPFLFSIKQPNIHGSGITFVGLLKRGRDQLELIGDPIIIDYNFLTSDQLRQFYRAGGLVLSRRHLMQLAVGNSGDDFLMKKYREYLRSLDDSLNQISASPNQGFEMPPTTLSAQTGLSQFSPPFLDLKTSEVISERLPVLRVASVPMPVFVRLDPFEGQHGIFIGPYRAAIQNRQEEVGIRGRLDFDSKTQKYKFENISVGSSGQRSAIPNDNQVVLFSINGHTHVLFQDIVTDISHLVPSNIFGNSVVTGIAHYNPNRGQKQIFLLLSIDDRDGQSFQELRGPGTYLIKMVENNGSMRAVDIAYLSDRRFSAADLNVRTRVGQVDGHEKLLFDVASERSRLMESGDDHYLPLVDVAETSSQGIQQIYLKSIMELSLTPQAVWKFYHPQGAQQLRTGIYFQPPGVKGKDMFVPGSIFPFKEGVVSSGPEVVQALEASLLRFVPNHFVTPVVFHQPLIWTPAEGKSSKKLVADVIPYLSPDHQIVGGLGLALSLGSSPGSNSPLVPMLTVTDLPFDFSRFLGVKLVPGRRRHTQEFVVLIFVGARDQETAAPQADAGRPEGVFILNYEFRNTVENGVEHLGAVLKNSGWLHQGHLTAESVKNRITFDGEGSPIWIVTPELEKSSSAFKVINILKLLDGEIFANRGHRVPIRFNESLDEDLDFHFRRVSQWRMTGIGQLEQRSSDVKEFLATIRKEDDGKKKIAFIRKAEALFPNLGPFLEELAKPNNPHQRLVLLVEDKLQVALKNQIVARLALHKEDTTLWSLNNAGLDFNYYDPTYEFEETLENLRRVGRTGSSRDVLYIDMKTVLEADLQNDPPLSLNTFGVKQDNPAEKPEEASGESSASQKEASAAPETASGSPTDKDESHNRFPRARLSYIASEGDDIPLEHYNRPLSEPRSTSIVVATPAQWKVYMDAFPEEQKAKVFDHFRVDTRFLTGSWSVWSPKSSEASKEVSEYHRGVVSKDEYAVFPNLEKILVEAASKAEPARHRLLVVPEEIKPLVMRLMMTRWASDAKEMNGPWNYRNQELALFQAGGANSQKTVLDNFDSMHGAVMSRRPVLLADMGELLKVGRPGSAEGESIFELHDPINSGQQGSALLGAGNAGEGAEPTIEARSQPPHMVWWLAAEGKRVQPKGHRDWKLEEEIRPEISTLIVATERELEAFKQEAAFENKFFDLQTAFEHTRLEKPSEAVKAELFQELLRRPEVIALQYEFKHTDQRPDEARRQLIGLMVGKVEQIAQQLRIEPTYAFLKMYVAFRRALVEDTELRRGRVIDAQYIFRLFAKVFPLPLSYEILAEKDPLRKLKDPEAAARGIQEKGYEGPLDLKRQVVRNLTAHTRGGGNDGGRKMPSSIVLIGETGTGKTFLIESLINYLGLKLYDFNKPNDDDAQAIIIRTMDIVENDDGNRQDKMTVKRVIEHLSNFLASRNGWRGLILFDDLHKAGSGEILKELMTFIQGMQDAQNGVIQVRRMSADRTTPGEVKEIPVRNVMLAITLNPTKDRDIRKKYMPEFGKKDLVMEAVAALHKEKYQADNTFFGRFADIIDMSEFPRDAKVPALLSQMREANQQEFSANPRLVLVTPQTLDSLVREFQKANARDFITPATYALLNLSSEVKKAPIYLIDPQDPNLIKRTPEEEKESTSGLWGISETAAKVEPGKIEKALRQSTVVHAVRQDEAASKLHLLSFLADNFRGLIYNSLILGSQASPMTLTHESRTTSMMSFLTAILGNISQYKRIPLSQIRIHPGDLGVTDLDNINSLQVAISSHASNEFKPSIEVPAEGGSLESRIDLDSFLGRTVQNLPERRRLDVMSETAQEIQRVLEPLLAKLYQVPSLNDLRAPRDWIQSLDASEPKEMFKQTSQALIAAYFTFSKKLYERGLIEMRHRSDYAQMQLYDEARLFLLCLDRAITQLPWSFVTQFTLNVLSEATEDLALGQRTGLQHFLFKSTLSPLMTVTPESIVTSAKGISVMRDLDGKKMEAYHKYFSDNCERFLMGPGN